MSHSELRDVPWFVYVISVVLTALLTLGVVFLVMLVR